MLDVMFRPGHTEENEPWSSLAVEELMAQSVLLDLSVYDKKCQTTMSTGKF